MIRRGPIRLILFAVAVLQAMPASAQRARAWIDSTSILIGQQVNLHLELTHTTEELFGWPMIPDTLSRIEVLRRSPVDTSWSADSSSVTRTQSFLLTCFDSGYYAIPPIVFPNLADSSGSEETEPMLLAVHTVAVDTSQAIREIKAPIAEPYTWQDAIPYAMGGLALAALSWLGYYLYKRRRDRNKQAPARKAPSRPAHEIALESLRKLEDSKKWQQGDYKGYHTVLTDIVRLYIEHRWQVTAMEMTTEEILHYPVIYKLSSDNVAHLKYMLELADYVKFAKLVPVAHENEQCLKFAYDFVLDTRVTAPQNPADRVPGGKKEEEAVS